MRLVSSATMERVSDALFRVARWQRQRRLIAGDPLALEPRIEPRSERLGFAHVYVPRASGETARWLRSQAYAGEAAKQDPIDICHLAIDHFHSFLETGDLEARDEFVAIARRILASGRTLELRGRTCFAIPHFDQVEDYVRHATPWFNAMVQGWAGAVLARAYQVTGEDELAVAARRSVGPCLVAMADGGVRDVERNGRVFYEKYALPGQPRHVLNGFMASLLGLWDVARATGDGDAHAAFAEGVATLDDTVLATYDNGHTSLYDQRDDRRATPSCVFYTWVHARQLAALSRITGDTRLLGWAAKWRGYTHGPEHRAFTAIDCLGFRARRLPKYLGVSVIS